MTSSFQQKISKIRSISTEEEFNVQYPDLFFTINDQEKVDLIPGGSGMKVTYDKRTEFVKLLEEYHLNLYSQQVRAICSGFCLDRTSSLIAIVYMGRG